MTAEREGAGGLVIEDLSVRYGGVVANAEITMTVPPGRITGLIGPNGAGKTTLVDAVSGFARATGSVRVDGRPIDRLRPHERCAAGLSRTWQAGELFDSLTVFENVVVAESPGGIGVLLRDVFGVRRAVVREHIGHVLELMGLTADADRVAGELPLGRQKLVGVARALAGNCKVILLDEPAAGLDHDERRELNGRLRRIAESGIAVLLIDHDMALVMDVCDEVNVLQSGRLIFSGPPAEALADAGVIDAYLGTAPGSTE
jgi:branched-chain amino acid transport system ATP-binding protein